MKKILLTLSLFLTILTQAQDTVKVNKLNPYISLGLSITNSNDFLYSSYPSIEIGLTGKHISGGLILGRGSLKGMGEKTDVITNYFYEIKSAYSLSITKSISGYGLFGIGNYANTNHIFIEYGGGFSYSINKFSYSLQASNWDGLWYVTPCLTFNF